MRVIVPVHKVLHDCSQRYERVMVSPPMLRSTAAHPAGSTNHCTSMVYGPFLHILGTLNHETAAHLPLISPRTAFTPLLKASR
jgi:hypothetical protein